MFQLWRMLVPAQFSRQPLRTLLVVFSIALGVATMVATQALRKGLVESKRDPFARGEILVVNGRAGVPLVFATELAEAGITGLERVHALVIGRAVLPQAANRAVFVLGWASKGKGAPGLGSLLGDLEAQGLRFDPNPAALNPLALFGKTLVVAGGALDMGGKPFTLRTGARSIECLALGKISGGAGGRLSPLLDQVVGMSAESASALVYPERPGTVSRLDLELNSLANVGEVLESIRAKLGGRAEARLTTQEENLVGDVTSGMELGFEVGGLGSLIVGLFLVYNVLSVSVEERRRSIGILRCAGATRGQIAGLFLGEALLLGIAGSVLGIPLGIGIARGVVGPMGVALEEVLGRPLGQASVVLGWSGAVIAIACGVVTAVLAALIPAWRASLEDPANVVRQSGAANSRRAIWMAASVLGMVALLAATAFAMVQFRHLLPPRMGAFGGLAVLLLASLLATPLLASMVGRACQSLTEFLPGVGLRLAADNLVRSGQRTGLVIAALGATGALVVQTAGFLHTTQSAVFGWVSEKVGADLLVTCGSGFTSYVSTVSMDEKMLGRVASECGEDLQGIMAVRLGRVDLGGIITYMLAVNLDGVRGAGDIPLELVNKAFADREAFRSGGVFVSENFLTRHGRKVGDILEVPAVGGTASLRIMGSVTDYTWKDGTLLVDREWYLKHFGDREYDIIDVWLKRGANIATVKARLEEKLGNAEALFVVDSPTMLGEIRQQLSRVNQLAYAQQAVLAVVALLGVVSSLFISVLQRKRQLGLLRAVGATRAQVLWTVTAEALLMGLAGGILGLCTGVLLEWYALEVLLWDEAGFRFPLLVPWAEVLTVLGGGVGLATVVGLWPAYMATRLDIAEAVAQE